MTRFDDHSRRRGRGVVHQGTGPDGAGKESLERLEELRELHSEANVEADGGERLVPNAGQAAAREGIREFWEAPAAENAALLTGGPGTGKSTATRWVVEDILEDYGSQGLVLMAPCNKAARALEQKLMGAAPVMTVASALAIRPFEDYATGKTVWRRDTSREPAIGPHTPRLVLDEVSMVEEARLRDLHSLMPADGKLLGIGDERQLAPPEDGRLCSLFRDADRVFRLEQVVRHTGCVLDLVLAIRAMEVGRPRVTPGDDGSVVKVIEDRTAWLEMATDMVAASVRAGEHPDSVRLLAFRNVRVEELAAAVRLRLFGPAAAPYEPGELLVSRDAISNPVGGRSDPPLCSASADLVVRDARLVQRRLEGDPEAGVDRPWRCWELRCEVVDEMAPDGEPKVITFYALDGEMERARFVDSQKVLAQLAKAHQREGRDRLGKVTWAIKFARDRQFGRAQSAYAITVHKSQGSTYRNVFVDVHDIDTAGRRRPTETQNRLMYVACSRASELLVTLGS